MSGLPISTWGGVTLNAVALEGAGRFTRNSFVLTQAAGRRTQTRVRPGVSGGKGGPRYKDWRDVQLEVFLDGRWDYSGAPSSSPVVAVASHILALRAAIIDAPGDSEGAVICSVTSAVPGTTHLGPVQVLGFTHEEGVGAQVVTFDLRILRGELAVVSV